MYWCPYNTHGSPGDASSKGGLLRLAAGGGDGKGRGVWRYR